MLFFLECFLFVDLLTLIRSRFVLIGLGAVVRLLVSRLIGARLRLIKSNRNSDSDSLGRLYIHAFTYLIIFVSFFA